MCLQYISNYTETNAAGYGSILVINYNKRGFLLIHWPRYYFILAVEMSFSDHCLCGEVLDVQWLK